MPAINMMIGNIGSGKSFLSGKLSRMLDAVVVNADSMTEMMAGYEYGRYDSRKKEVYQKVEDTAIETSLSEGFSVVIDRTNMDVARRARFMKIGEKYGAKIVGYDFGPGSVEELKRRVSSPRGVPASVWSDVHRYMFSSYEKPTIDEGFSEIITPPARYRFHAFDLDGTIIENRFPEIGDVIDGTVDLMNALYSELSNVIIVWTCRSGDFENQARKFLREHHIPFDFINENPLFETGSRKIYANKYYDDRNCNFQ